MDREDRDMMRGLVARGTMVLPKEAASLLDALDAAEARAEKAEAIARVARSAARKLSTMYVRGECQRRHELDRLILELDPNGPAFSRKMESE